MKIHTVRVNQDTHFGQTKLDGGAIIATISMEHDACDLGQVLSMIQYRQASVETTTVDDETLEFSDVDSEADEDATELFDDGEDEDQAEDDIESPDDVQNASELSPSDDELPPAEPISSSEPDPDSLESLGLDESLTEAIKANKILTKSALREYIDNGNDLLDLEKIGGVRAKKILAALESQE
jgi:hypothetical protein